MPLPSARDLGLPCFCQRPRRAARSRVLELLATRDGLTVAEYLVLHPGYKLTGTEKRKYEPMVLRAAARMIEEARR